MWLLLQPGRAALLERGTVEAEGVEGAARTAAEDTNSA